MIVCPILMKTVDQKDLMDYASDIKYALKKVGKQLIYSEAFILLVWY